MKRIRLFLILTCATLFFFPAKAERVNMEKAEKIARSYARTTQRLAARKDFRHSRTVSKQLQRSHPVLQGVTQSAAQQEEPLYHVFSMNGDGGFIIISGDDVAKPVLGYSDEGTYDESNPNLAYWMETLAQEIAAAIENGVAQGAETKAAWDALYSDNGISPAASGDYIDPLVKTKWNQDVPYNNSCPTVSGTRTYTGCVATAMAQIMKYYGHPIARTVTIPGYTTRSRGISISAIGNTTYSWDNMTNTYTSSTTGATADAVATLMYHCGASVKMDYNTDGSGAYSSDVVTALKSYFSYDAGTAFHRRNYYTYTAWVTLLKTEIRANRPVYYAGYGNGGHAFVCDGYDADDLFHFNWGWGGSSDGYFEISALNPGTIGIGGGSGGYNEGQEIITGIQPNQGNSDGQPAIQLGLVAFSASQSSLNNVTAPFSFTVNNLTNIGSSTITRAYLGVLLYNENGSYHSHQTSEKTFSGFGPNYYYSSYTLLSNYSLPAGLSAGTYKLYPAYSASSGTPAIIPGTNGNRYITIVVGQNGRVTLTSDAEKPALSLISLKTVGSLYRNKTGSFEAEITNSGTGDYNSRLSVRLGAQTVATDPVVIPAGATKTVGFSGEITLAAGAYSLSVWHDPNNVPESTPSTQLGNAVTVEIKDGTTASPSLALAATPSFQNGSSAVPQNGPNLTVKIKNTGGFFDNAICVFIFPATGGSTIGSFGQTNVRIEENETKNLLFNNPIDFTEIGTRYMACVYHYDNGWKQLGNVFNFTVAAPVYSSDATLKNLVVKDAQTLMPLTLTPAFLPATTSYTTITDNATTMISIIGEANHKRAKFTNIENQAVSNGNNTFNLKVTAEDGTSEKTYTITINKGTSLMPGDAGIITTTDIVAQSLTLNWTKATDNVTSPANLKYYVYQSTSDNVRTVADCEANGTLLNTNGAKDIATYLVTGLMANTTYYFNVIVENETGNKVAYTAVSAIAGKAVLGGAVTVSGNAVFGETLTAIISGLTPMPSVALGALSYQWKRNNTVISGAAGENYTLVQADIATVITVTVTAANTQGSVTSNPTTTVAKAPKAAPATPELDSKTDIRVTLKTISGARYARATTNTAPATSSSGWQDTPEFTGLTPSTTYYFFAYYPETTTHGVSPASAGLAVTTANEASLIGLAVAGLTPPFDPGIMNYTVTLPCDADYFMAIGTPNAGSMASYSVNGVPVTLPLSFGAPGITSLVIHVAAQEGIIPKDYTIAITRPFATSIIRTYWDDVLAVNLNMATNGGYEFTGFQWTRNGQAIANETGPYLYFSTPPPASDRYGVLLTADGQTLPVCSDVQIKSTEAQPAGLLAYPNPARYAVTVENPHWETTPHTDLINLSGNIVRSYPSAHIQTINVAGVPMGLYILRAGVHTTKIVIE